MITWSMDYEHEKLPKTIRKGNVDYSLKRTFGAFPVVLNYSGWENPYEDRQAIAIQSYGDTEEEAVEMMLSKLRKLGLDVGE